GPGGARLSLNYAFMPAYPLLMRAAAWPARVLGLGPVAAAALGGVVVSALGTLAGATALYHLARQAGADEAGGLRAAWYLLVFPSSRFLAQVYTEGLFVGLAFGCLALLGRQRWLPAAGLAVLAALTRPVGVALAAAIAVAWAQARPWRCARERPGGLWAAVGAGALAAAAPVLAYAAWRASTAWKAAPSGEARFFGRQALAVAESAEA